MQASVVVAPRHLSTVSGAVAFGLGFSSSVACGIFSDQGRTCDEFSYMNLCFMYWQMDSLPWNHQGSPQNYF